MSIGGNSESYTLKEAIDSAKENTVLVAAAGNSNDSTFTYPAAYDGVIAVAATTNADQKADFSSFGNWVEVAAPGENIFSTFPNHNFTLGRGRNGRSKNYDYGSGTSMSTPMVAGLAGLILSIDQSADVWETIQLSCDQGILAD
jgi:thermitase